MSTYHNLFKRDFVKIKMEVSDNPEKRVEVSQQEGTIRPKKFFGRIPKHNWAIATYAFAVLALLLVVSSFSGGLTGSTVSETKAGEELMGYLTAQVGEGVEIVSSKDMGSLYEISISYQGRTIPLYVTKDGKYLVQGIAPLEVGEFEQEPAPQEVPKSDKPIVELFVMSHCPFGTQMEKGILPVVELLGDKIDFEVKFVYYAMHGEVEVTEELNQYCIQKEQGDKFLDYLTCFLEDGDGDRCLTAVGIDREALTSCTAATDAAFDITKNLEDEASWLSGRFPLFNIYKEDNEKYDVGGSPTLIINGVQASAARNSASLLSVICSAFNEAPKECETELSSATPSSGFGYESGGSDSQSQCG